MAVAAFRVPTATFIEAATNVYGCSWAVAGVYGGRKRVGLVGGPRGRIGEPSENGSMGVLWALPRRVIVVEAEGASRDGTGPASEGLVVEAGISHRPVEVPPC